MKYKGKITCQNHPPTYATAQPTPLRSWRQDAIAEAELGIMSWESSLLHLEPHGDLAVLAEREMIEQRHPPHIV